MSDDMNAVDKLLLKLGRTQVRSYKKMVNGKIVTVQAHSRVHIPKVAFHEVTGAVFAKQRDQMPDKYKPFLTPHPPENFGPGKTRAFLSADGKAGFAVAKNGEIVNVFALPGAPKGIGATMVLESIARGGTYTENFDGFLRTYYESFGFRTRTSMKWDDQYAPDGWDYEKYGRPDVLEMDLPKGWTRDDAERKHRQT